MSIRKLDDAQKVCLCYEGFHSSDKVEQGTNEGHEDKKENLGTSPGFVTEDFVTDSIASSPGCKPSANRR